MTAASDQSKIHVACPSCFKENRVAADRLGDHPICGKCGAKILEGKSVTLNASSFDDFMRPAGLPVLVEFLGSVVRPV
jgi:thioredoxin 2